MSISVSCRLSQRDNQIACASTAGAPHGEANGTVLITALVAGSTSVMPAASSTQILPSATPTALGLLGIAIVATGFTVAGLTRSNALSWCSTTHSDPKPPTMSFGAGTDRVDVGCSVAAEKLLAVERAVLGFGADVVPPAFVAAVVGAPAEWVQAVTQAISTRAAQMRRFMAVLHSLPLSFFRERLQDGSIALIG